jgi:hypothetical protein
VLFYGKYDDIVYMARKLRIDWKKHEHLLGQAIDQEVAKIVGCTGDNVKAMRRRKGVPSFGRPAWTAEDESLLKQGQCRCVGCKKIKSSQEFHDDPGNKIRGRKRTCKECVSWLSGNRRDTQKLKFVLLMGGQCSNCGFEDYLAPLQFHHIEGDSKEHTLSLIMPTLSREDEVLKELDKCCLLCSNCHDAYHASQLDLTFEKIDLGHKAQKRPQSYGRLLSKCGAQPMA